jgi:hypothetical protein
MSTELRKVVSLVLSASFTLGAVGLLGACPGTLSDPARFDIDGTSTGSCTQTVTTTFATVCAVSGCHTTSTMAGSLDLQAPDIYMRLAGKPATGGPGVLIDPGGNPDASVLYLKLTPTPPFGLQMPLTGAKLDTKTLACFASWIKMEGHPVDAGDASTMTDGPEFETSPPSDAGSDGGSPDSGGPPSEAGTDSSDAPAESGD